MARGILHAPATARPDEVVTISAIVGHPMETGYRVNAEGQPLPRDLVRRVECRFDGELVFAADLHAAVAANPYVSFTLRATASGTLSVSWQGDNGYAHSQSVQLTVT
jgi:sulfur-oxidizing protein SoxZ